MRATVAKKILLVADGIAPLTFAFSSALNAEVEGIWRVRHKVA